MKKDKSLNKQQIVSAQVVLQPKNEKPIDGGTKITAENIKEFEPPPDSAVKVREIFASKGFEIGSIVGISFSITASVSKFEELFKTRLRLDERGGVESVKKDGSASYELSTRALPKSISDLILTVSFTPPPDFGPTEFFET